MGLGSKLKKKNKQTNQQLEHAKVAHAGTSVTQNGYTSDYMGVAPVTQMNSVEVQEVQEYTQSVQAGVGSTNSLQKLDRTVLNKPTVPLGANSDKSMINQLVTDKMWRIVILRKLQNFFTQQQLQTLVDRACRHDYRLLMREWQIVNIDMTCDLAVMGLYDIVVMCDDSGSMNTKERNEDNMKRWTLLDILLETVGFWSTLMDPDGIVIRFLNYIVQDGKGDGVGTHESVEALMATVPKPKYGTPTGHALEQQVLNEIFYPLLQSQALDRPLLVLTLTDGKADDFSKVVEIINTAHNASAQSKYGEHAIAWGFCQIGSSGDAQKDLQDLDRHRKVGHLVDCTSNFQCESQEIFDEDGIWISEATYLIKLLIGAIDPAYDEADEGGAAVTTTTTSAPPSAYGQPQAGYGQTQGSAGGQRGQPHGGYGQTQGSTGGPPGYQASQNAYNQSSAPPPSTPRRN